MSLGPGLQRFRRLALDLHEYPDRMKGDHASRKTSLPMTWSLVARDPRSGRFAVAVTTRFFAVGALCPHAQAGAGALATQALVNPRFGPLGLALLHSGASAQHVVDQLVAADPGAAARQLHVVDRQGRSAAFTGSETIGWSGHRLGDGFSVAGNMLAGQSVIDATFESFAASAHRNIPLGERLLDALDAGQAQGGDKRGKQSAALIIQGPEQYPELSLRVDDHAEPLAEIRRLYEVSLGRFSVFREFLPTESRPGGVWDRGLIEAAVARREAELGLHPAPAAALPKHHDPARG